MDFEVHTPEASSKLPTPQRDLRDHADAAQLAGVACTLQTGPDSREAPGSCGTGYLVDTCGVPPDEGRCPALCSTGMANVALLGLGLRGLTCWMPHCGFAATCSTCTGCLIPELSGCRTARQLHPGTSLSWRMDLASRCSKAASVHS